MRFSHDARRYGMGNGKNKNNTKSVLDRRRLHFLKGEDIPGQFMYSNHNSHTNHNHVHSRSSTRSRFEVGFSFSQSVIEGQSIKPSSLSIEQWRFVANMVWRECSPCILCIWLKTITPPNICSRVLLVFEGVDSAVFFPHVVCSATIVRPPKRSVSPFKFLFSLCCFGKGDRLGYTLHYKIAKVLSRLGCFYSLISRFD